MNEEVIKFYKDLSLMNDEMYEYLKKCVEFVREDDPMGMSFVGCYTKGSSSDGKLEKIKLFIPKGESLRTTCIQVHEIGHFIDSYSYLGKEYEYYSGREIFPIAMERIFFENTNNSELLEWFNDYQKELIDHVLEFKTTDYYQAETRDEHILGFLHHFDYVDFYHKTNSLPQILSFNTYKNTNIKEELIKKLNFL